MIHVARLHGVYAGLCRVTVIQQPGARSSMQQRTLLLREYLGRGSQELPEQRLVTEPTRPTIRAREKQALERTRLQ